MTYVLDSCVASTGCCRKTTRTTRSDSGMTFWPAFTNYSPPNVYPVEIAHALTRAERRCIIPAGDADVHLLSVLSTSPLFHPALPLLRRAVAISSAARIGVYDCLYVALAEREGCELVTADLKLVKTLQPAFPFITPLGQTP
jgi:predicted nucleic acid-binding protein